jgi:hypothetical protein
MVHNVLIILCVKNYLEDYAGICYFLLLNIKIG